MTKIELTLVVAFVLSLTLNIIMFYINTKYKETIKSLYEIRDAQNTRIKSNERYINKLKGEISSIKRDRFTNENTSNKEWKTGQPFVRNRNRNEG